MNDEQIVAYCKRIIKSNLQYYDNKPEVMVELFELSSHSKEIEKRYLAHFKGLRDLLNKAIEIVEKGENKNE